MEEARSELAHARGGIAALKAKREQLRQRVLKVARGEVCGRCGGVMQAAG